MQMHISTIFDTVAHCILGLTLYEKVRSSHDFEEVKSALNDRTNWSTELFRSCLTIHFNSGSHFFTVCAMLFLVMSEGIHVHYGRLSPAELKECAESMGYLTFALLFAVLDLGFFVVRIAGLVALSRSPGIATGLVFPGMLPSVVLPLSTYVVKLVKPSKRGSDKDAEVESSIVDVEALK